MNEYCKGAFEALSWLESLLPDLKDNPQGWKLLEQEVNDAMIDIKRGIGVDFRYRLKATASKLETQIVKNHPTPRNKTLQRIRVPY